MFSAWCENFYTCPFELAVTRQGVSGKEIFLIHRDDQYFKDCWHLPGTVIRPRETMAEAYKRLIESEVKNSNVGNLIFRGFFESLKGDGPNDCPRGQEFSFFHEVTYLNESGEISGGKFFPLVNLPTNTLSHQKKMIAML